MNLSDATVAQVLIPVEDFERGTAFYRDTLGIPIPLCGSTPDGLLHVRPVRLLVGVAPPGQKAQRGSAIYFRVSDIREGINFAHNGSGAESSRWGRIRERESHPSGA
jgi:catechol 2,3-dioxygenase-like lactoylglutathione lyase family enzyme